MKGYTLMTMIAALMAMALATPLAAQENLIPAPRHVKVTAEGRVTPPTITRKPGKNAATSEDESYSLRITPREILIEAPGRRGMIWAERTLEQLRDSVGSYPQVVIEDSPAFALRGFMYDTGRNFVEVSELEKMIDLISRYKLNTFHWHLTDNPAWRIESRVHPELNDACYQRIGRDTGRFYTYDDIRHILNYARERGVMIIPEIDMPGHSAYFPATFGVPMNSERGMQILSECLDEFFSEFTPQEMPIIHIGSDEIHIDNPEEFMAWAVKKVEDAGRTPMVWDPGLAAGSDAIYQVWREANATPESLTEGKKIVDSYHGYLNYVDPVMLSARLFLHPQCITGRGSDTELGGILCLWNDVRVTDKSRLIHHNSMMGGVLPIAERLWAGGGSARPFADVLSEPSDPDMQALASFQEKMAYHRDRYLPMELRYWKPNRPATAWDMTLTDRHGSEVYGAKAYGDMVDFDAIIRANKLDSVTDARLTRTISVPSDTVINVLIGFEAPPRSDRISDGIPAQGKWENYGTVTVDGRPVLPPVWDQPSLYRYHFHTWGEPQEEQPYTDEQLYWMRRPVAIPLHAGDNVVTLTTRRHFKDQRFQAAFIIED